jgi:poly-beta-1,6-N-acetyl-D-glucosamine N-deacetylase PgaB
MRRQLFAMFCLLLPAAAVATDVPVLVYHDIVSGPSRDGYAVQREAFAAQLAFLHREGYRPVRLRDLAEAAAGRQPLPPKAMLLTFDDGLASFREHALPLLEKYGYPAVLSVVGAWLDGRQVPEDYRGRLLDWPALRELSRSPLIEIVPHTYDLHHGIPSNPQGNMAPASITRRYDAAKHRYESEPAFRQRIRADLALACDRLRQELALSPKAIVWPYGHYDGLLAEEARALGLNAQLTLGDEVMRLEEYPRVMRMAVRYRHTLADFERLLRPDPRPEPLRLLEIALDTLAQQPPAEQEQRLSGLLARAELLRVNVVIVSPFSRDARQAFFATPDMPSAGDVLNRILHQLRVRAAVDRLILRLPAAVDSPVVLRELARRHPYDAVLFDPKLSPVEIERQRSIFAYYRPGLRCGMQASTPVEGCRDFIVVNVPPGMERATVTNRQQPDRQPPGYFLLQNGPEFAASRLGQSLRALGAAGARHRGLHDQEQLAEPALLRQVAEALGQHVIAGERSRP